MKRIGVFWPFLLCLWLAACGQPAIQPLQLQAVPWSDGERSVYQVSDSNQNFAGTATMTYTVGMNPSGGESWILHREVAAQGDQELVMVEMSMPGLRPMVSTLERLLSGNQAWQRVKTTYNQGQLDLELTTARDVTTYERVNVPSDVRDQRTLLSLIRTLPLAAGYATQVNSFLPITSQLERTTIHVVRTEEVQTPAGTYQAWRLDVTTPTEKSQAWVATGLPHLLVKFVDGRNGGTYELREYVAGE
ncbi:MAG: DUF3108 domain-containing protein [Caldilineaceae bacterium]|nr:DUF3108 domain-containing protein [Caldilineaceae bacterium]